MNRYLSIICIFVAVLAALGFFAYNFLEIYDREVYESPSPEVRSNDYLALQRWLSKSGHPVQTSFYTDPYELLEIDENVVLMKSSSFYWEDNTFDILSSWIEKGNHLFIFHDYWHDAFYDDDFYSFVEQFDVKMITPEDAKEYFSDEEDDGEETPNDTYNYPYLDQTIQFTIENDRNDILFAGAGKNMINLVHVSLGKGTVTFTGQPFFMQNNNLRKNENRMLAWNLTGAKDIDKQGILFIQEIEFKNTFFQDLINEGNIFPLLISIFILTIICFWGFIPRFGKISRDEESPGKPIRERFLAEAIFLKKFHSLAVYIDIYEKNIQQRFRKKYGEYIDDKKLFCIRLAEVVKLDGEIIEQSLYPKRLLTSRSFAKCMKTIEIILERL